MGSFLGWLVGLVVPVQDFFCSALAALVGPVQKIFYSPYIISIPLSPSPSMLGRQPCWVAFLLVFVSENGKRGRYAPAPPNRALLLLSRD